MEQLNHFSHENHPLVLLSQVEKKVICYGCPEQILEAEAAYGCFQCNSFLHKTCAELPRQIIHPMHSQHPLILLSKPLYPSQSCTCNACGQGGLKFFTYNCSLCEFDLDVSCAILDRGVKLECHDHPLIQLRPATFFCNACRKEDKDSSYLCTICPFWIHKRCASMPSTLNQKNHNHSLLLAYSLPLEHRNFEQECSVCHKKVHPSRWIYYCGPCRYFTHINCVEIYGDAEQPTREEQLDLEDQNQYCKENLVKLPSTHATQELITHFLLKGGESSSTSIPEVKSRFGHELSLSNKMPMGSETTIIGEEKLPLLCDVCVEPISDSDPRYGCDNCGNYFLHMACCELPNQLQIAKHPEHTLDLVSFKSVACYFKCNVCGAIGNCAQYKCKTCDDFVICIKCTSASFPTTMAHNAHKHPLIQIHSSEPTVCNACGGYSEGCFVFGCEDCCFYLSYICALLPPTTKRPHDHPLILIYPPYPEHPDEFYCVICELEMNPNHWMYHCSECDYSIHPRCNPRFSEFRNLKFGQSLLVHNHPHPLIHVPEAKYKYCCKVCGIALDWKVACECQVCSFALCLRCARQREVLAKGERCCRKTVTEFETE